MVCAITQSALNMYDHAKVEHLNLSSQLLVWQRCMLISTEIIQNLSWVVTDFLDLSGDRICYKCSA